MRILLMADVVANPDSGAAGTEYQTVEALRRQGHEVDAVWADSLPHKISHGNFHYLAELPFAYRRVLLERMNNTRYDVVHVNQPHGYLAAKALNARKDLPVFVHRSHGLELRVKRDLENWQKKYYQGDTRPWFRRQASRFMTRLLDRHGSEIAKYADGHVVSASECAQFLIEELDVPATRIAVIPQAAPSAYLDRPALPMTKQRLSRVLFVGQYAFFKAPMIVAAVINQIVKLNDEVEVTWVTSKSAHSAVIELLSETARRRVTLLDWMTQEKLIHVYDNHGIFLFPSFFEGFGKVFLEAMTRGLCVVAANNGGARDVIDHEKNGFLVPTGEIAQMTKVCVDAFKSLDQAQSLSQRAALTAREYSWDRVANETVAFYELLIRRRAECRARV